MEIKAAIEELETLKALYEFVESVDMSKPVGAIALGIQALKNEARRLVLMDWYERLDLLEECEVDDEI